MQWPLLNGPFPRWSGPVGVWCALLWVVNLAGAQSLCDRPHLGVPTVVTLTFNDPALQQSLGKLTERALQSTLASGFILCQPNDQAARGAAATITLEGLEGRGVRLHIRDRVTDKVLIRDLALGEIPADSHALAIAVACDELLRASWLELSLAHQQPRQARAPEPVKARLQQDLAAIITQRETKGALHMRGALNWFSGGIMLFGADVGAQRTLGSGWSLGIAIGGRQGTWHTGPLGRARLSAATLELDMHYDVFSEREVRVSVTVGAMTMLTYATAQARDTDIIAKHEVEPTAGLRLGVVGHVPVLPVLGLRWEVKTGYALRSVSLDTTEGPLASSRGLEIQLGLGFDIGR